MCTASGPFDAKNAYNMLAWCTHTQRMPSKSRTTTTATMRTQTFTVAATTTTKFVVSCATGKLENLNQAASGERRRHTHTRNPVTRLPTAIYWPNARCPNSPLVCAPPPLLPQTPTRTPNASVYVCGVAEMRRGRTHTHVSTG